MVNNYLKSIKELFQYYRSLGDKTIQQLTDEQLFLRKDNEDNSVAILVNHLNGNMLSRWTNFLIEDGEKEWRTRDEEFENSIKNSEELLLKWNSGWDCLFIAIESINKDNFRDTVYIRNQGHSVLEAINRQLGHYSYHVGQMVLIGKSIKGSDWKSLSIPRGESKTYNATKFSQDKRIENFTSEFINPKKR